MQILCGDFSSWHCTPKLVGEEFRCVQTPSLLSEALIEDVPRGDLISGTVSFKKHRTDRQNSYAKSIPGFSRPEREGAAQFKSASGRST